MLTDLYLPLDKVAERFTGRLLVEIQAHASAAVSLDTASQKETDPDVALELESFAARHLLEAATLVVGYLPTTYPGDDLRLTAEAILEEIA